MRLSLWKPISQCAALIFERKEKRRDPSDISEDGGRRPALLLRRILERRLREALDQASEDGCLTKTREMDIDLPPRASVARSRSLARLEAQRDFLRATAAAADRIFDSIDSIPNEEEAQAKFLSMYSNFQSTDAIDRLRSEEYSHLVSKICLDYCGFGLFSYLQILQFWESSAFSLSEISVNLSNHILYGGPEPGTAEHDIKARIMDYLNIPESDYGLIFTVSRGSAFKLLSDCYPFQSNPRLLTMFDYESQSVNWMAQAAREKGAKTYSATFRFPSMKLCSAELRKKIAGRRRRRLKRGTGAGLFVFPVQSRVSGTKYSYQWMALAQQNNWHVLLDAGALGPKDMDSLGLSLFRPDFIVTSFYRVFGHDPTGFGCLLIKKSVITNLKSTNGGIGTGMVRIMPEIPQYLSDSADEAQLPLPPPPATAAFSGMFTSSQVRDVLDREVEQEESSENSMGDVMKSPVFSEDDSSDNSNSMWIDLGQSPRSSASPLPWLTGRRQFPPTKISFDAAILSMSQELPEIQEEQALPEISEDGAAKFRRETEHDFRLLDRREGKTLVFSDEAQSLGEEEEEEEEDNDDRRDPEIVCRHLDQVGLMGLNKTALRLRYLVNWLVTSLLQLRLSEGGKPLVQIYGPKIKYERGPSVAFNIIGPNGLPYDPDLVQRLAEREGISLGIGFLSHVKAADGKKAFSLVPVVSASLGFLSNFEDVYRMWVFAARFLDPEFGTQGGIGEGSGSVDVAEEIR